MAIFHPHGHLALDTRQMPLPKKSTLIPSREGLYIHNPIANEIQEAFIKHVLLFLTYFIWFIYNVVLISDVQQSDSAVCVCVHVCVCVCTRMYVCVCKGLPWWLSSKKSTCQCRRYGFSPWVRKILWRRKWLPTPVFLSGKSRGQRRLVGFSPWGHKELDTI